MNFGKRIIPPGVAFEKRPVFSIVLGNTSLMRKGGKMRKPFYVILALGWFLTAFALMGGAQDQQGKMQMSANMNADDGAPKVGDVAPLFKLDLRFNDRNNEKSIDLHSLAGKQPIVLLFGSYT